MAKNIVLCADGTGNRGGETPDSNVYRVYKLVELHDPDHEQVKFYDNGVGTSKNKYWRAVSGAFGGGFKSNVCDLYQFLARSYEPGDRIFLFGFSRGSATMRAFSGFLATCGLLDGRDLHQKQLREKTECMFQAYRASRGGHPEKALRYRQGEDPDMPSHGVVPIQFLGVWDSVAALGLPQGFKEYGILVRLFGVFFKLLEWIFDKIFPHRFYLFDLTPNVLHACHALSIDDERKTFLPLVWDENASPETRVEQVWFAGVHSNVGGGYARNGLSSVALEWMMVRAEACGLHFEDRGLLTARNDANYHGRLFDSRDGAAIFYRLQAREIEHLCTGKLRGRVKVHEAVAERTRRRTANYAPALLPYEYEQVATPISPPEAEPRVIRHGQAPNVWRAAQEEVLKWIGRRQALYTVFLETTILIVLAAIYFWQFTETKPIPEATPWQLTVWKFLEYIVPKAGENLAHFLLFDLGWQISLPLVALPPAVMLYLMGYFRQCETEAREKARRLMM